MGFLRRLAPAWAGSILAWMCILKIAAMKTSTSSYSVRRRQVAEPEALQLKFWCKKVADDEALLPKAVTLKGQKEPQFMTYCNILVQRITRNMGYKIFDDDLMLANDIYDYCMRHWIQCMPDEARDAAMRGELAIAASKGDPHGHCAVCYPDRLMLFSGKWNIEVPYVANAGDTEKRCGIIGANWAFKDIPEFFRLGHVI